MGSGNGSSTKVDQKQINVGVTFRDFLLKLGMSDRQPER